MKRYDCIHGVEYGGKERMAGKGKGIYLICSNAEWIQKEAEAEEEEKRVKTPEVVV